MARRSWSPASGVCGVRAEFSGLAFRVAVLAVVLRFDLWFLSVKVSSDNQAGFDLYVVLTPRTKG